MPTREGFHRYHPDVAAANQNGISESAGLSDDGDVQVISLVGLAVAIMLFGHAISLNYVVTATSGSC